MSRLANVVIKEVRNIDKLEGRVEKRIRRFPFKRSLLVIVLFCLVFLFAFMILMTAIDATFSIKNTYVGLDSDIKFTMSLPKNVTKIENIVILVTTTSSISTSTTSTVSTTTTTERIPIRDYNNTGVSYVYNRDKDWLGPCGAGGLGR